MTASAVTHRSGQSRRTTVTTINFQFTQHNFSSSATAQHYPYMTAEY
jgi:hypothetical protein